MTALWIARLIDQNIPYGPMDAQQAAGVARFLTAEVDPAEAIRLRDPVAELLGWRDAVAIPDRQRLLDLNRLAARLAGEANPSLNDAAREILNILDRQP